MEEEIFLLRSLQHPNLVKYFGTKQTEEASVKYFLIFTEWVPGGSLLEIIERFGSLCESVVRSYTSQIVQAVWYVNGHFHPRTSLTLYFGVMRGRWYYHMPWETPNSALTHICLCVSFSLSGTSIATACFTATSSARTCSLTKAGSSRSSTLGAVSNYGLRATTNASTPSRARRHSWRPRC